jgi:hypothetical protein
VLGWGGGIKQAIAEVTCTVVKVNLNWTTVKTSSTRHQHSTSINDGTLSETICSYIIFVCINYPGNSVEIFCSPVSS